jgi:predicted Ser/Thr protein kinase
MSVARPLVSGQIPEQFGRYRVLRKLGEGGMAAVFLARDPDLDRQVAVKVPFVHPGEEAEVLARFRQAAQAVAQLHHPNICPVYEVGQADGVPYLVMAYVEGQTLAERLQSGGALPEAEAVALVRQLALALQEAHERGVIHRDLKPSNVILNARGEPVLIDFGLARRLNQDLRLTRARALLGSPSYMAPEQVRGEVGGPEHARDIYSLGVVLYELASGRLPFHDDVDGLLFHRILTEQPLPPSARRPGLSAQLDRVCLQALAKRADQRFASMAEFAAALGPCATAPARPAGQDEGWDGSWSGGRPDGSWSLEVDDPPSSPTGSTVLDIKAAPPLPAPRPPRRALRALGKVLLLGLLLAAAAILGSLFLPADGPHHQLLRASFPTQDPPPQAPADEFKGKWEAALAELQRAKSELDVTRARWEGAAAGQKKAQEELTTARGKWEKALAKLTAELTGAQAEWKKAAKQAADNSLAALNARAEADAARIRAGRAAAEADTERGRANGLADKLARVEKAHKEARAVVRFVNHTGRQITYEIRWQRWDGTVTGWDTETLAAGNGRWHSYRGGIWVWVRFDKKAGAREEVKGLRFEQWYAESKIEHADVRSVYNFELAGDTVVLRWARPN